MISALILAAGASRRMGSPKALLTLGGKTFLQHIVDTLSMASTTDITVVLGADAAVIQKTMGWFRGNVVINEKWEEGQLSSIVAGVETLTSPDIEGVLISPVDHPLFSSKLVNDMVEVFHRTGRKIVVPAHNGKRGHPVIFHRSLFDELKSAPIDVGARAVVLKYQDEVFELATEEKGVLVNIDTREEYERAKTLRK